MFVVFVAPEAPIAVKALVMSGDSILVSWRPPSQPNGVISQYTIYTKAEDSDQPISQKVPPNQLTHEASGLNEKHRYDFWVTASTNIGEGQASKIVALAPSASGKYNLDSRLLKNVADNTKKILKAINIA